MQVVRPSYSHVERLTYIILERDRASSQTGYAYQHSYYFVLGSCVKGEREGERDTAGGVKVIPSTNNLKFKHKIITVLVRVASP